MLTIVKRFKDDTRSMAFGHPIAHELVYEVHRRDRLSGKSVCIQLLDAKSGKSNLCRHETEVEAEIWMAYVKSLYA